MKRKLGAIIATIGLLTFSCVSVYATDNTNMMQHFLDDGQKIIEENIKYYEDSMVVEDYKITLEQSLSDEIISIIIISIEGLTPEAKESLNDDMFMFNSNISLAIDLISPTYNEDGEQMSFGYSSSELKEYSNESKHYYYFQLDGQYNIESIALYYDGNLYPESYIEVPIENNLDNISIHPDIFVETDFYKATIKNIDISNIGMFVELEDFVDFQDSFSLKPEMFFLMQNGEIKTISQLTSDSKIYGGKSNEHTSTYYIGFNKSIDLSDINSIVISDTAYPLDGGEPQKVHIDENLRYFKIKPFIIGNEGPIYAPVEELCEKLGAEFKWIEENEIFSIDYRGKNLELTIGADTAILNDEEISMIRYFDYNLNEDTQIYDGVLISSISIFDYIFDIGFSRTLVEEEPIDWEVIIRP